MPYRVFISYSHEDRNLAEMVCAIIMEMKLEPLWDERFAFGRGFHEQIKTFIAHSHVFLPIITESSSQRGWVHQEIGYAVALKIPVLPVALGKLPAEMLRELHAIVLTGAEKDHESQLREKLTSTTVNALLSSFLDEENASYETAPLSEDRALLMTRYARQVQQMGRHGMLRQKGGLSSLHVPDQVITHPVWRARYGPAPKDLYHCRCLRDERLALEYHARQAGFRLIIDPDLPYETYGPAARVVRLRTLIDFLSSVVGDSSCQVAFHREDVFHESVTILGDWFYAESVSAAQGSGYRQTIFTRHAPSMQSKIDLFDREFAGLLDQARWSPETALPQAIRRLKEIAAGLDS